MANSRYILAKAHAVVLCVIYCGQSLAGDTITPHDLGCTYDLDGKHYDLTALKKPPTAKHVNEVYDHVKKMYYTFNVCGGVKCGKYTDSAACSRYSAKSSRVSQENIRLGVVIPSSVRGLTGADLAQINWKTQHYPPFAQNSQGVVMTFNAHVPPPPPPPAPPPPFGMPPAPPGWQYTSTDKMGFGAGYERVKPSGGPVSKQSLIVMHLCDPSLYIPMALQNAPYNDYNDQAGNVNLVVASAQACPKSTAAKPKPKSQLFGGLVWGWWVVIGFGVVVFLYLAIGMTYNYKKLGKTGFEMVPNSEFWRDFPGLVKDGLKFSYANTLVFARGVISCVQKMRGHVGYTSPPSEPPPGGPEGGTV